MDPFYNNPWNPTRHSYSPRVSIQPRYAPKVVNIPVHFVGSGDAARKQSSSTAAAISTVPEGNSRVAAAIAIQKAVRGFLVRKNVRLVRQVAMEVETIERKVREDVKIRLDPRERLRVSEELMALLLRLDSARGVRDFRKRVIGRVIGLQEAIDSVSEAVDSKISTTNTADPECLTGEASEDSSIVHDGTLDLQEKRVTEAVLEAAVSPKREADPIVEDDDTISKDGITEDQDESRNEAEELSFDNSKESDQSLDVEMVNVETSLEKEISTEIESPDGKSDIFGIESGEDGARQTEAEIFNDDEERAIMAESSEEDKRLREMIERMAMENEGLKMMVAQLCETSAEQCRLMQGLADRVNQLERHTNRMVRRKKRRSGGACSALSSTK